MLPMNNGSRVIAADLRLVEGDAVRGIVLAQSHDDFVTWHVAKHPGHDGFEAFWGHYFSDMGTAMKDYNERRFVHES